MRNAAEQVAHRLDSIMGCDVVIVMEEGRLVECGAPMQLLRRRESRFAAMHRASHGTA
jgi:ABC-type multidrug transport system fused ATPase/permease subunit